MIAHDFQFSNLPVKFSGTENAKFCWLCAQSAGTECRRPATFLLRNPKHVPTKPYLGEIQCGSSARWRDLSGGGCIGEGDKPGAAPLKLRRGCNVHQMLRVFLLGVSPASKYPASILHAASFFPSCLLHLRSSRQKAGTSCLSVAPPSLHTRSSNIPVFCWEFLILLDPDLNYFFAPNCEFISTPLA
jgi:hypothetical protein